MRAIIEPSEGGKMKLRILFEKNDMNYHGTQAKGETWNEQTIRGWKLRCVDLLRPIKEREKVNPEGGKTRAKWYKRFILYFPSGSWWNLDIALLQRLRGPADGGKA